jgi:hypothetical protein
MISSAVAILVKIPYDRTAKIPDRAKRAADASPGTLRSDLIGGFNPDIASRDRQAVAHAVYSRSVLFSPIR